MSSLDNIRIAMKSFVTEAVSGNAFVVIAYRYGGLDWSFPIGVFKTEALAKEAAEAHWEVRGGKYEHRIFAFNMNTSDPKRGMTGTEQPAIDNTQY